MAILNKISKMAKNVDDKAGGAVETTWEFGSIRLIDIVIRRYWLHG